MSPKDLGDVPIVAQKPVGVAFDVAVKDIGLDPDHLARLAGRPFPSIDDKDGFRAQTLDRR